MRGMSEEELEQRLWAWDLYAFPKPGWLAQALNAFLSHNPKSGAGPIELLGLALSRQDRLWLGAYPGAWQIDRDPMSSGVFDKEPIFLIHDGLEGKRPVAYAKGLDELYSMITTQPTAPSKPPKPQNRLGAGLRKGGPTLRLV